jgi:hypothetical protein
MLYCYNVWFVQPLMMGKEPRALAMTMTAIHSRRWAGRVMTYYNHVILAYWQYFVHLYAATDYCSCAGPTLSRACMSCRLRCHLWAAAS